MRTKVEILDQLDLLRTSYEQDVDKLFEPVIVAVEEYFAGDEKLTHDVHYTIHHLAQDLILRETVYEKQELMPPFPENYPVGYEDVRDLFIGGGSFEEIMAMDVDVFNGAYVFEEPSQPPISNPYLDGWLAKLEAAREQELTGLETISSFCESTGYNCGLAQFFEQMGDMISSPELDGVAQRIYNAGGYKEIIHAFGINVYIPTTV